MWLGTVPGGENSAEMGTQQTRFTAEFVKKDGVLSRTALFLFETELVTRILLK